MQRLILVGVAVSAMLGPAAFADQIILKNGDRLTGMIIKSDGESLSIQSEFAGKVTVQWAAIESWWQYATCWLSCSLFWRDCLKGFLALQAGKRWLMWREKANRASPTDGL